MSTWFRANDAVATLPFCRCDYLACHKVGRSMCIYLSKQERNG